MFICNIKINGKLCFKIIMISMGIIVLAIFFLSIYKLFWAKGGIATVRSETQHSNVTEISPNNYTNILKAVHEDIDSYLGKEIKFSGYIYKIIDFEANQFVLARDMIIDSQSYVVGFLCEYNKISELKDNTWIEIIGTISKGKYHNTIIPIIKIKNLETIPKPENEFVLPPDHSYIPTSAIL